MEPIKEIRALGMRDYVQPDDSQNIEIPGSRWILMQVVSRVFPLFFKQLRYLVYPDFARLAASRPGYCELGWTFEAWQLQSDADQHLTPVLLRWARQFHAEETWILEGALHTLWKWHRDPELLGSLDIGGFRSPLCGDVLITDEERLFTFEHDGWDPQFQSWGSFRESIEGGFEKQLNKYNQRLSSLMESRGAIPARKRFSLAHFEWFALYQLKGLSSKMILGQRSSRKGDESTILKGVKAAASLLQWEHVRKARKARPQSSG